jgi:hypothetical protein
MRRLEMTMHMKARDPRTAPTITPGGVDFETTLVCGPCWSEDVVGLRAPSMLVGDVTSEVDVDERIL